MSSRVLLKLHFVSFVVKSLEVHLFGDLDTADGAQSLLEITIDGELAGSQGSDHEETGTDTGVRATETKLTGDLDQAAGGALTGEALGLVDLGEHGVGGLRNESGGETSNQTRAQVGSGLHAVGERLLGEGAEDSLRDLLEDDELGHGVGDLLEQNGSEAGVESTDTLVLEHLGETANETVGVGGLRDETDTGSLERAQGNVGEELGGGRGGQVDGSPVVGGSLNAQAVDELGLEELVTAELEGTLQEVTGEGRAGTSQKSASALILDDLAEAADETAVVGNGVELDTGLDDIDGSQATVGDGAADSAGEGEAGVESEALELLGLGQRNLSSGHCD